MGRNPGSILALGSNTKNTVCFFEKGTASISPVHKDLRDLDDFRAFEKDVGRFLKKKPAVIAYDLHPEYISTKYAHTLAGPYLAQSEGQVRRLCGVQHHHAHIASCMADNGLGNQKVIGVAFDGTGMGYDDHIWGAEFLLCDYAQCRRAGHLREIPLLGMDQAILQPWRLSAAWLGEAVLTGAQKRKWKLLQGLYSGGFVFPLASSMGRLFDAAGSLVFGRSKVSFEGELAIALEKIAARNKRQVPRYRFMIAKEDQAYVIDPAAMMRQIFRDVKSSVPKEVIAYRFHLTVAGMVKDMCVFLRSETGIRRVVLSGGVFQNKLLLKLVLDLLYKDDFEVFTHKRLQTNDSGLSLGQAVIASFARPTEG